MPEYGRYVQDMVNYCKAIDDPRERQKCANSVIAVMANIAEKTGDEEEFRAKLWNHLAAISDYELDITYPVPIEREESLAENRDRVPYPQQRIERRHYGAIVEKFTKALTAEDNEARRYAMARLVANHMKRDLSNWNLDAMSDAKVADDMAWYTEGKVKLTPSNHQFISDGELLSSLISTSVSKKKRRK